MTTAEIVKELRAMAAQCIDAPKGKHFFTETADRLEDLERTNGNEPVKSGDRINVAREAILQELRRRWKERPTPIGVIAPADISRFHQPQTNYFCGAGTMKCPICNVGKLQYARTATSPPPARLRAACSGGNKTFDMRKQLEQYCR